MDNDNRGLAHDQDDEGEHGAEVAAWKALDKFSEHNNWSLEYVSKFYADDFEPKVDHWAVFEEHGSINDRQWNEIGAGATPQEAIAAAIRARSTPFRQPPRCMLAECRAPAQCQIANTCWARRIYCNDANRAK